ncbi:hypothetical protein BDZ89DRAFT_1152576 [Hymenopellis radicata]|nr:hypothetical protein BDZ89DRAFT_1152576 [Hymenopellis radicata]
MPPERTKPVKPRKKTYKKKPKEERLNLKGWMEGSRQEMFLPLNGGVTGRAARDKLKELQNLYEHHFGHLEDHEDPEDFTPYDPLIPKINNDAKADPVVLEAARKKVLFNNDRLKRWLDRQRRLMDGPSGASKGRKRSTASGGLDKAPKQPHAAHVYGRHNKKAVADALNAQVGAGRGGEERAQSGTKDASEEGARDDAATVEGASKDVDEDNTPMDASVSQDTSKDVLEDNTAVDASKDPEVAVSTRVEEETEPVPLSVRDKVMRDLFKQQPAAVQEKYKEMAKVEGDQAKAEHKRLVENGPPKDAASRAKAAAATGDFVADMQRTVEAASFLKVFSLVGGPYSSYDGELGSIK